MRKPTIRYRIIYFFVRDIVYGNLDELHTDMCSLIEEKADAAVEDVQHELGLLSDDNSEREREIEGLKESLLDIEIRVDETEERIDKLESRSIVL